MADFGAIASAATAALIGYSAWRDFLKPKLDERRERDSRHRREPDSERPSRPSHVELDGPTITTLATLSADVSHLKTQMSEFRIALDNRASADELSTFMKTTENTLRELTGSVGRVTGTIDAYLKRGGHS